MDLEMKTKYTLTLTPVELGMICRSLRGLAREEEGEASAQLADAIARARVRVTKPLAASVSKLESDLNESRGVHRGPA